MNIRNQLLTGVLRVLADVLGAESDPDQADALLEEALAMHTQAGSSTTMFVLAGCGYAALRRDDYTRAENVFKEHITLVCEVGPDSIVHFCLEGLVGLAEAVSMYGVQESKWQAVVLFGAAQAIRERSRLRRPPARIAAYDRAITSVCASLGEDNFNRAWTEGKALSIKQVLDYALEPH